MTVTYKPVAPLYDTSAFQIPYGGGNMGLDDLAMDFGDMKSWGQDAYGGSSHIPFRSGMGDAGGSPEGGGFFSNLLSSAFGRTDEHGYQQGWAGTALKTFGGLASAYLGMKQYGLAKDVFKENTEQFNLNYDGSRQTTNAQLRDRQIARVETGNSGYQSVGEYMPQNEIAQRTA